MTIELKSLLDLVLVVLIAKLIVSKYRPPIQESLQALICLFIGTSLGVFLNSTKEGFITGLIASGFAFYGGELFNEFKSVKENLKDDITHKV